jgi:hypothetical protein
MALERQLNSIISQYNSLSTKGIEYRILAILKPKDLYS